MPIVFMGVYVYITWHIGVFLWWLLFSDTEALCLVSETWQRRVASCVLLVKA